jgi:hypothetical protein
VPPRRGCRLAVTNEALLHNAKFVIIRPIPTAFTVSRGENFDLRAVDKVGHKVGLTIGASPRSDGRPRRLTLTAAPVGLRFDSNRDTLILGHQNLEPLLRWYYPRILQGRIYASDFGGGNAQVFAPVYLSKFVARSEMHEIKLSDGDLFVFSEKPSDEDNWSVDEILETLDDDLNGRRFVRKIDDGPVQLAIYSRE